ncbi:MAG: rhomboid family intramembrane serine protease, partial [Candidatus Aenigmatarchaeota archaeon]
HRLPEIHDCAGLEEYKERSREEVEVTYEPFRSESKKGSGVKTTSLLGSYNMNFMIIAACFGVFILQIVFAQFGQNIIQNPFSQALYMSPQVEEIVAKPWMFVTSIFLHGGSMHLFINMLVLFFFGGELERRVGSRKYLEIFLVSGVMANLGFTLFSQVTASSVPAVGASGAIFGVFAVLAVIAPEIRVLVWFVIPMKIRHVLILFTLWDLFLLPHGGPIANSAHLTGVAVGVIYGLRLKDKMENDIKNIFTNTF